MPCNDANLDVIIQIAKNLKSKNNDGETNTSPSVEQIKPDTEELIEEPVSDLIEDKDELLELNSNVFEVKKVEPKKRAPNGSWTDKELKKLKKLYETKTVKEIAEGNYFPKRTYFGIKSTIVRIGLKKSGVVVKPKTAPHMNHEIFKTVVKRLEGKTNITREDIIRFISEEHQKTGKIHKTKTIYQYTSSFINYMLREDSDFKKIAYKKYSYKFNKEIKPKRKAKKTVDRSKPGAYQDHVKNRYDEIKERQRKFTAKKKQKIISDINRKVQEKIGNNA